MRTRLFECARKAIKKIRLLMYRSRLGDLGFLLLGFFGCLVAAYRATRSGAQYAVSANHMASHTSYYRAFKATLGAGHLWRQGQGGQQGQCIQTSIHGFLRWMNKQSRMILR